MMYALSLWQPWASLWLTWAKVHETRNRLTHMRGPVAVHAGQYLQRSVEPALYDICFELFGSNWRNTLPRGALLGHVNLIDCQRTETIKATYAKTPNQARAAADLTCGDFRENRFGWKRDDDFRALDAPVPFKGKQGFFFVPEAALGLTLPPRPKVEPAQLSLFA